MTHRSEPPGLAVLFQEHGPGLAGAVRGILGRRADVAELLQEAFLKAWQALQAGAEPSNPVAWVFVLTMNLARDQRRASQRRGRVTELDEVDEMVVTTKNPGPHAAAENEETLGAARAAIHDLEEDLKSVFLLRVSGGLGFAAIANSLGIPVGTAKTRMRRALAQLRQHLSHHAPAPVSPRRGGEVQ